MIPHDDLSMKGSLTIRTYDLAGQLIDEQKVRNKIVLGGRELVARLLRIDGSSTGITHMGIGRSNEETVEGSDSPVGNTDLIDPIVRRELNGFVEDRDLEVDDSDEETPRSILRVSIDLPTNDDDVDGESIQEAGLFNADEGGTMYNRVTFGVITKSENVRLSLVWEIVF